MAEKDCFTYKGIEYDENIPWIEDEQERLEAVLPYLIAARNEHVEQLGQMFPGFVSVVLRDPIELDNGITLPASTFFVDARDDKPDEMFTATPTEESLKAMIEAAEAAPSHKETDEDGNEVCVVDSTDVRLEISIDPIMRPHGGVLRYTEVLMAYALEDAEGDEHLQRFILRHLAVKPYDDGGRRRNLPRQDVRKLHRQNDPTSKLLHVMTNPALFSEHGAKVDVASPREKGRGREVKTAVSFSWSGEGIEIYREISQYDREVHGGVSSLWADGQRVVTAAQIAKATGLKNPTKTQIKKVAESVDLQRRVFAKIDFTEEARGRHLTFDGEPVETFKLEGYLLAADKTEIETANGRIVEGYILHRAPLLYQHASMLKQVTNYPQSWLDLGEGRDSEQRMILRRELIRRVSRITTRNSERGEKANRNIRFTTDRRHPGRSLLELAGVNQKNRDTRKSAIDYAMGILDRLAERDVIADYKPIDETGRGGTRTVGAEIILQDRLL